MSSPDIRSPRPGPDGEDWVVGPSMARALLSAVDPSLRTARVRALAPGWDNTIYRVGPLVARFPKRSLGNDSMEVELAWLPFIGPRLPVPTSAPTLRGSFPGPLDATWKWAAYPALPGTTAERWPARVRDALAPALAAVLQALWRVEVPPDPPPDVLAKADMHHRWPQFLALLDEVPAAFLPRPKAAIRAEMEALLTTPPWSGPPRWVHGDLHPRNLLVFKGVLSGVIDWGDTFAGDPAVDLAIAWYLFTPGARAAFLERLGTDHATADRARARALFVALAVTAHGLRHPDSGFARVTRRVLATR